MTNLIELAPNILASQSSSIAITGEHIKDLKQRATASPLQRARILAHTSPEAPIHEMLIVQTNMVYVRPHRHHNKSESLLVIEGSARIVFFDDNGTVEETLDVGPTVSGAPFYLRSDSPRWHTQLVLSPFFVFQEVTGGPLKSEDTEFAAWAPEENDSDSVDTFMINLAEQLGISPFWIR